MNISSFLSLFLGIRSFLATSCWVLLLSGLGSSLSWAMGHASHSAAPLSRAEQQLASSCPILAQLVRTEGQVRVTRAASPFPLRDFELPLALCADDQVQTVSQAQALIQPWGEDGPWGEMVLAENSRLRVRDAQTVDLDEGLALFEITQREGGRFVAQTPLVVIGVKGTRFLVNNQEARHDVALFRGLVEVARQDGQDMAYYRARPVEELTYAEYLAYQRRAFRQFQQDFHQAFNDYRQQVHAEFQAFVRQIDVESGRQFTWNTEADSVEVIDAPIHPATQALGERLEAWLKKD